MKQLSIFDFMFEKKLIKKPIRIIELFGGYGSQYMALKYLGANVESYKLVEWEVAAIEAYTRFHHEYKHFECDDLTSELYNLGISNDGKVPMTLQQIERRSDEWKQKVYNNIRSSNNLVNILTTKGKDLEIVEKDKYEYIMTYSFPCQDLSLAGKGAGLGEGTRSGLLWQVERILLELKELNELPQILLMENVPMILSPKYRDDFAKWDLALSKLGYKSYVKNLMATDYLIPQIRNRTFMISILGEYSYSFPYKLKKEYILKDFLENNVDESYYLSDKQISDINNWKAYQKPFETMKQIEKTGNSPTITTRSGAYAAGMILVDETAGEEREVKEYKNYVSREDGNVVVKDTRNLKEKLCDELIESKILKVGDVINHSYTNSAGKSTGRIAPEDFIETTDGTLPTLTTRGDILGVVVREEYQGMYQYSKSDKFMKGKDRFTKNKEFADTFVTTPKEGVVVKGVVVKDNNIYNSLFTIFDLCCIIDTKEKDKYERSRELLQILWEEIGKKEIWQEIRRFISIQEKKILQSNLYENGLYKDRKPQSKISTSTPNSSEYNESITNREKMFDMWKNWKTRYTPQRWELSEQQFRQFNLFMQELSYETTQGETSMQDMWQTNERFRILQQTLFKIQEIWRPNENKISNGLRIRKLTPREVFRLMGVKDRDYDKIADFSNSSLYKLAGNSIVIQVLMGIFGELLGIDYKKKIKESVKEIV